MCTDLVPTGSAEVQSQRPRAVLTHADVVSILTAAVEQRDAWRYYEATARGSERRRKALHAVRRAVDEAGL